MAQAGFYHCPTDQEPDLVKCFVCHKELDGWEPSDVPRCKSSAALCDLDFCVKLLIIKLFVI